jgi:Ca2+:H+ antiporter
MSQETPVTPKNQAQPSKAPMGLGRAIVGLCREPFFWLLVAMPVAVVLENRHVGGIGVFIASAIAIIPLAGLMGRATESLSDSLNPTVGGLLNATFGNAAELIIALFALAKGPELYPLVKASITGSIIGNILLVMGASLLAGGLRFRKQKFNGTNASMGATLLALASVGLIMPALFFHLLRNHPATKGDSTRRIEYLSEEIAGVLAFIYLLSLIFTLVTHRDLLSGEDADSPKHPHEPPEWTWKTALAMLVASTAAISWMSHLLVGAVEEARTVLGMTEVFTGVIVVAVIGNAAEHSTAILMAMKNRMDATVQIAVGSAIQIALFVAPVLVFASMFMGHAHPLDLHFSLLETVTVVISVGILALVCQDGETHWMEGVMMLGVYVIVALAFYNLPG